MATDRLPNSTQMDALIDAIGGIPAIAGPKGETGPQGPAGPAATINGVTTLTVTAGDNVALSQSGSTLTISATDTTYAPASAAPLMDGTAAVGTSDRYAREDHRHPTDTSRAAESDLAAAQERIERLETLIQGIDAPIYLTASGDPAVVRYAAAAPVAGLTAQIQASQAGSGDPSAENIRPITGWNSVTARRTGKDLIWLGQIYIDEPSGATFTTDPSTGIMTGDGNGITWTVDPAAGTVTANGTATAQASLRITSLYLLSGERTYAWSGVPSGASMTTFRHAFYWNDRITIGTLSNDAKEFSYSTDKNWNIRLLLRVSAGYTADDLVFRPMLRLADGTDDTFEPYSGQSVTISLPETVYGGSLDLLTGTLTVTHGSIASYAGEPLPGAWISDRDVYVEGGTPTIGAQVVYELAAPITRQLTPQSLSLRAGYEDLVWAETGAVSVRYQADPAIT